MTFQPVFLDAESAGLRGEIFSAALIDESGGVWFNGFYRHDDLETNSWLRENVLPKLSGTEYSTRVDFLRKFTDAYLTAMAHYGWEPWGAENGKRLAVVTHMGVPVESNLFQQLYEAKFIREYYGPYPFLDTAALLLASGYDPTSEQNFAESRGLVIDGDYAPHSALHDARLTRLVWMELLNKC